MNDEQLRTLIREAVARHVSHQGPVVSLPAALQAPGPQPPAPSHYQYLTLVNVGDACLIEPAVKCNHCGYCKCHGY